MSFRLRAAFGAVLGLCAASVLADTMKLTYPSTRKVDLVEQQFGEKVADPYRWLENDVRTDKDVADWVARENTVTQAYLGTLGQRAWFGQRIKALMDYERFGLPQKAGKFYFYTRNSGLQNQSQLFVRQGLNGAARLLIDPNGWAKDGATALDGWEPSKSGRLLAYSVQDGGTDWRIIRLLDTQTGKVTADEIKWAKFTGISWIGDKGFLYSRFPAPVEGQAFQSRNFNQAVYFHRIGTAQETDELVFDTPDQPEVGHAAAVVNAGRYAVITSGKGTDSRWEVRVIDLKARKPGKWPTFILVSGFEHKWQPVDGIGNKLWFVTDEDAPRGKLVSVNMGSRNFDWQDVVPQHEETLEQASIVGDKLILSYLKDASTRAEVYDLSGRRTQVLTLNGIGTASGFVGKPGDPETFYSFTSFNQPAAIRRLDLASGASSVFAAPKLTFDPANFVIEQRFFPSKDGTKIPMFLVRRKDVAAANKPVPTLLYGYGGFDISLTPAFSATRMAWLEAGGAFAMANLRGGGEYGKAWHDGGRLNNKQNVFDDFIAAGEFLIAQGITPKGGLAVQGGSNGGLLVGAVVNQRPDLFAAANAQVGVMDMLRFDRFTAGRYWVDDYGYPSKEADWRVLRAYSPYHNIRMGVSYPAMLVTTADTDDRVVPGHSFKYAAALQAADPHGKPHLIRIETRAGHGAGKPTDKVVAEGADTLAFLAQWTGLAMPN